MFYLIFSLKVPNQSRNMFASNQFDCSTWDIYLKGFNVFLIKLNNINNNFSIQIILKSNVYGRFHGL